MESNPEHQRKPRIYTPDQKVDNIHVSDVVCDFAGFAKSTTSEHQRKPGIFTPDQEVDYIRVSDVVGDFPGLA